jgi:hypothetical protein
VTVEELAFCMKLLPPAPSNIISALADSNLPGILDLLEYHPQAKAQGQFSNGKITPDNSSRSEPKLFQHRSRFLLPNMSVPNVP